MVGFLLELLKRLGIKASSHILFIVFFLFSFLQNVAVDLSGELKGQRASQTGSVPLSSSFHV